MKIRIIFLSIPLLLLQACNYSGPSISMNKNTSNGISTTGIGLSCNSVYVTEGKEKKISGSTFTYGGKFHLNFNNIKGFEKENGNVYPGMMISVMNSDGDTLMHQDDAYGDQKDGFSISPLLLRTAFTAAKPIISDGEYKLAVFIWDKKGKGTFTAKLKFKVKPNEHIKLDARNASAEEIYLFSQDEKMTITGNEVNLNETFYFLIEGLQGFHEEDGNVFPGLSMMATDANNKIVVNEKDLYGDTAVNAAQFKSQVAPNFIFTGGQIKNPIKCKVEVWDKKSRSMISATIDLNVIE